MTFCERVGLGKKILHRHPEKPTVLYESGSQLLVLSSPPSKLFPDWGAWPHCPPLWLRHCDYPGVVTYNEICYTKLYFLGVNVNNLKVTDHSNYVQLRNDMKMITKHTTTVKELLRLTTVCIDF